MESSATWWVAFEAISTFLLFATTVVLAAIAIFPEHVRQLIYKPLAHVFYGTDDYLLQQMSPPGVFPQLYLLRLRVKNVGKSLATLIECHVTDIRAITPAGREQRLPKFIPVRLRWTHSQNAVADYLAVGTSRVVNVADITGTTGYLATGNQPLAATD